MCKKNRFVQTKTDKVRVEKKNEQNAYIPLCFRASYANDT